MTPSIELSGGQVGFLLVLLLVMLYHSRAILLPIGVWLVIVAISIYALTPLGIELPFHRSGGPPDFGIAILATAVIAFACHCYRK